MQTRKDDAAIPYNHEQDDGSFIGEPGLTKREYFAGKILEELLAGDKYRLRGAVYNAVSLADLLIARLNETRANEPAAKPRKIEQEEWTDG